VAIEANRAYQMEITAAGMADNAAGDKTCIEMELLCEEGKLWHRIWLTEAAKARTATTLAEFGISASDSSFWVENCQRLVGQIADVETEENVYNNKTTVRVRWFNGPNRKARVSKAPTQEKVAKIATMFADDSEIF